MLKELQVYNFLLIEELSLDFDRSFIVFTGETGAGKSLLIKAIKLLLGEKAEPSLILSQKEEAEIDGIIYGGERLYNRLKEAGFSPEEEVHIRRIITKKRQRSYLNGKPISLSELKNLLSGIISLTSQHEFYTFLKPENYLTILDIYGGLEEEVKIFSQKFKKYREIKEKIEKLKKKLEEAQIKKEFLNYQLKELEEAGISPEEEIELIEKREKLKNLALLKELAGGALHSLSEAEENLSFALSSFEKLQNFEKSFKKVFESLYNFFYELKEIERELETYLANLPEDESELDSIEERLSLYEKLKKKYHTDVKGLLALKEKLKKELTLIETGEEEIEKLEKELEEKEKELLDLALNLSEKRKKIAQKFEKELLKELKDLALEKAVVRVEVKRGESSSQSLTPWGLDKVDIKFSSNPGIKPLSLHKVASGGELSRIFLAIKAILKNFNPALSYIFDEIDTGIGGITAKKLAFKLKKLSEKNQVICITHLPQIAALADLHYQVEKKIKGGKTFTQIRKLEGEERLKEISRMIGAEGNIELAKKLCQELLS